MEMEGFGSLFLVLIGFLCGLNADWLSVYLSVFAFCESMEGRNGGYVGDSEVLGG